MEVLEVSISPVLQPVHFWRQEWPLVSSSPQEALPATTTFQKITKTGLVKAWPSFFSTVHTSHDQTAFLIPCGLPVPASTSCALPFSVWVFTGCKLNVGLTVSRSLDTWHPHSRCFGNNMQCSSFYCAVQLLSNFAKSLHNDRFFLSAFIYLRDF